VGKTSLAKEIQRRAKTRFAHLEADRLFPAMSPDTYETAVRERGLATVVLLLHRSMAVWAGGGLNIIVDGSLP
jgi:chloramphenicol 3-O-phosphotransferase